MNEVQTRNRTWRDNVTLTHKPDGGYQSYHIEFVTMYGNNPKARWFETRQEAMIALETMLMMQEGLLVQAANTEAEKWWDSIENPPPKEARAKLYHEGDDWVWVMWEPSAEAKNELGGYVIKSKRVPRADTYREAMDDLMSDPIRRERVMLSVLVDFTDQE